MRTSTTMFRATCLQAIVPFGPMSRRLADRPDVAMPCIKLGLLCSVSNR